MRNPSRTTQELFTVSDNVQAMARTALLDECNSSKIFVGTTAVIRFDHKNAKWCIHNFEKETILSTSSISQAVCYFVELEGPQEVLDGLNDSFEITVDTTNLGCVSTQYS